MLNKKRYCQLCSIPCLIPKPQFKITRTRSTQPNFTVIIRTFLGLQLQANTQTTVTKLSKLCLAGLCVLDEKNKNKIKKR